MELTAAAARAVSGHPRTQPLARLTMETEHSNVFKASRQQIIEAVKRGITSFFPNRANSRTGMGFHLSQKWCKCQDAKRTSGRMDGRGCTPGADSPLEPN